MKNKYLECGKIINKRGISGELKVECYCDTTASIKKAKILYTDKDGKYPHNVISIKDYKGFLYIKLDDVNGPDEADLMRGKVLYVDRNVIEVSDGRSFIADLVGLDVIDADNGHVYGKIKEVRNFGASDIYVISDGSNEYMLPAVEGIVIKKNLDSHILVRPIQGIFDEAEEIK